MFCLNSKILLFVKATLLKKSDRRFLSRVSTLTRNIDIAILSACLSVHLSVRNAPVSARAALRFWKRGGTKNF